MSKRKKSTSAPVIDDPVESHRIRGEYKVVKIGEVRPNTFNYNKQSAFIYEKMLESLREFGFVDPLDVRSGNEKGLFGHYEVIGGEHRLRAAEELGYKEVPVNDIGIIEDTQAKKLCIVLNETKGKPDNDALASLIAGLNHDGVDLEVLPFDSAEISAFIESTKVDFDNLVDNAKVDPVETGKNQKETIISVMGLLEVSDTKEAYLIAQFKKCMGVMRKKGKPITCFERMMDLVIEG